ncbi:MAG: bifunctional class I SAM-dependent methyltransferase/glycosyltransferase family 2 protein [Planctomycetota bacterium]
MSLGDNLREMERGREAYWSKHPGTSPIKLRWRALTVRHCFHVLPGQRILEVGAGTGLWTEHLTEVLRGENPITAATFHADYAKTLAERALANTSVVHVEDLDALAPESFDYVVGTAILCHDLYPLHLKAIHRLLKPGGQMLFFEANLWNPQVLLKNTVPLVGRWTGQTRCQVGMRKFQLMQMASHQGFVDLEVVPYDIVHPRTPRSMVPWLQQMAFIAEHAPLIRNLCGTLYIWGRRPGTAPEPRARVDLAEHRDLFGQVSFVIPCHNEEMNVPHLVATLVSNYDAYIHEIVLVNDNSTDRTSAVAKEVAAEEPRVVVVDRTPPNGVGRALRDGYAAATGRYILTMDCDFVQIVPEFRDLFDAVAAGHEGAIGSRFSHESILINYPFFKTLCNRTFHLLINVLLRRGVRDVSNNLKLYRAEILKGLEIEEGHFAANAETGLKPLIAGHDVVEVPTSWINRTPEMGRSSFHTLKVAPAYAAALARVVWRTWRGRRDFTRQQPLTTP